MAGVRQQLDGAARAPGGPHREPGAHVSVRNQRVEILQRVCVRSLLSQAVSQSVELV